MLKLKRQQLKYFKRIGFFKPLIYLYFKTSRKLIKRSKDRGYCSKKIQYFDNIFYVN